MIRLGSLWVAWLSIWSFVCAQQLIWLGVPPGGYSSVAWGVSNNAQVVIGTAYIAGTRRAFVWHAGSGMSLLPIFDGAVGSEAWAVSDDGHYAVGTIINASFQYQNIRWDLQSNTWQNLGTFGGAEGRAQGISADGSVVVGYAFYASGGYGAYRWTPDGGLIDLGSLGGGYSWAYGVSADGSTVVGRSFLPDYQARPFRWKNHQMIALGNQWGTAIAVSSDGSVVVGSAYINDSQYRAFIWREDTGIMSLNTWNANSSANDVSDDGTLVVGYAYLSSTLPLERAFQWTPEAGEENLNQVYASLLTDGSVLLSATRVSANGRYIVGAGYNASTRRNEAFLIDRGGGCEPHNGDVNSDGCVDDADLLSVLFAFGQAGEGLGRVDVNCDRLVDDADLLQVLFQFGTGC
jgi:probable HAF family extracellular repeat protein